MKMEKREQELKDAEERCGAIERRIDGIPVEIETIEKRISERKASLAQMVESIEGRRKERQRILVTGGDVSNLSAEIRKGLEEIDLTEDECVGLQAHLILLRKEEVQILKDRDSCKEEIVRLSLLPLIAERNRLAAALASVTKEIFDLVSKWGFVAVGGGPDMRRFVKVSSGPYGVIPHMSLLGEPMGEDFLNVRKRDF
jgi:chromosome segregation ATPase